MHTKFNLTTQNTTKQSTSEPYITVIHQARVWEVDWSSRLASGVRVLERLSALNPKSIFENFSQNRNLCLNFTISQTYLSSSCVTRFNATPVAFCGTFLNEITTPNDHTFEMLRKVTCSSAIFLQLFAYFCQVFFL